MSGRQAALALHRKLDPVWRNDPGFRGILTSTNHSTLGRRFILAAFFFFAIGGILAMLIRAQLATPDSAFLGPEIYNQIFTMHGSIMMFLFAIPMFEGLAMYLLPKMLGARDMAFPRLSALGWWCYLFGGTIIVAALIAGVAPDAGWFLYPPLSGKTYTPGINSDVWLLGVTFVEISAMCAAIEIAVSILKLRADGMSLDRMPIFAWYLLATAGMMLFGFPPLILGSILLELERAFGWPFFAPEAGGSPLLWQHLFWLFGHPEVYIIFLPAAGAVSTILPVMARTRLVGYGAIVAAVLALAFLSFGLWVHHMFTTGIPHMALGFFSAASALVAIPTAVQMFAWAATLWAGRPEMKLPMLYLMGFFITFVIGGLTGVMLAMVPFDAQAHDTAFVTAHLHYVLVGGFIFPMLGAAIYWLPHFSGRRAVTALGAPAFWLIFGGFHLTFLAMHLTGLLGMPRRIETYDADMGWTGLNLLSSFGGFVQAIGFALFAMDVGLQIWLGRRHRRDPWRAETLEWAMPTPPASYNFASLPTVTGRAPLREQPDLAVRLARGEGLLAEPRNGRRETLAVDIASGRPHFVAVLPANSMTPLLTALTLGGFFLAMLGGLYAVAPLFLAGTAACCWRWAAEGRAAGPEGRRDIGDGRLLPDSFAIPDALGHWGSLLALAGSGTLFASLLFGFAFLAVTAPGWPAASAAGIGPEALAIFAGAALTALPVRRRPWAQVAGVLLAAAGLSTFLLLRTAPTAHAFHAACAVVACYALFHLLVAGLMLAFALCRREDGPALAVIQLWLRYAGVAAAVAAGVLLLAGAMA